MIGTSIRGIRHLWRVSDYSLQKILVRCGEHGFDICEVFKTSPETKIGERMFIFNSFFIQSDYGLHPLMDICKDHKDELSNVTHSRTVQINDRNNNNYNSLFSEITLLPNTFDKDYKSFLKENSKMIKSLMDKYGFNPIDDCRVKRLYIYTEGSKNFFQWACNLYFKVGCSMRTIYNILLWNENYKQLTKNLSKGTITAYTSQDSINSLLEELSILRNEKRANDAINSFNTIQKKLLRNNELSDSDRKILAKFYKLSDTKKTNFIRKVSTIEDFQELMRQLRHVTSTHFEWSKESFMDFINNVDGIKYDIIYENDLVVLVKVADYETVKQLGKTTNWCISKNKSYWNNYVEHTNGRSIQYMIFDFSKLEDDKLSIIGFTTTHNKGITSAHNFVNDNLMEVNQTQNLMLKSYLSRFDGRKSIYGILSNCGIDINLVAHYDRPLYEWSYDGLMSYLYECVDKNNVDIIKYDGQKLVLSVCDDNIKYFFGDAYIDNIPAENYEFQHIIFADFSMSKYDPNKLTFGIIYRSGLDEDYCNGMFNEISRGIDSNTFETKLVEFDVPYDIIRRADDIDKKLRNAFASFNINMVRECVKKDKECLHRALTCYFENDSIYHILNRTLTEFLSFDLIDLIYDSGHKLCEYLNSEYIGDLLKGNFSNLKNSGKRLYRNNVFEKPSEERVLAFYDEKLNNRDDVMYIGSYLIVKKIIQNENASGMVDYKRMYNRVISSIYNGELRGGLIKELMHMMINNIDMSHNDETTNRIICYIVKFGDDEMKETLKILSEKYAWVSSTCESMMRRLNRIQDCRRLEPSIVTITTNNIDTIEIVDTPNGIPF